VRPRKKQYIGGVVQGKQLCGVRCEARGGFAVLKALVAEIRCKTLDEADRRDKSRRKEGGSWG
jgi:hypothetical protein